MRFLLLSSVLALLFACSPTRTTTGKLATIPTAIQVFQDTTTTYLYKNKINIFGHYLSGLMLIKPMSGSRYKVAITTEFGAKIMDFELVNGEFVLNYCIPELQRKKAMAFVAEDMKLLFGAIGGRVSETMTDAYTVYTIKNNRKFAKYTIDKATGHVNIIEGRTGLRKKTKIELSDYAGGTPQHIELKHARMPVRIEMNLVKR